MINEGTTPKPYTPHQADKKQLLFLDDDGTWKKPILREWDSIEKHSDGKYYYHKRSGLKVFRGGSDESWTPFLGTLPSTKYTCIVVQDLKGGRNTNAYCDKFRFDNYDVDNDLEYFYTWEGSKIYFNLHTSKFTDVNS